MIISEKQIYFDRFLKKVDKKDCWNWIGAGSPHGYGQFKFKGRMQGAHRASWQLHNGDIPKGLCVLHKCDNRKCVNPEHLCIGTHKDNTADMMNKKRGFFKCGENNYCAKLTEMDVKEIFNLSGILSQREIAKKFNVTQGLITSILSHRSWKSVTSSMMSMSSTGIKSNQKGIMNARSKLSEKDVKNILKSRGLKTSIQLGREFNVTSGNIRSIWAGRSWPHINIANQQSEELKMIE